MTAIERLIERPQQLRRSRIVGSDNDAIRLHEVADRSTFFEKLRIRDDIKLDRLAALGQHPIDLGLYLVGGPNRHGGFVHDIGLATLG